MAQVFRIAFQLFKIRTGSTSIGDESLNPALLTNVDQSLLVYPAWQLLKAINVTRELNVELPVLNNVSSRHMSYGQAAVLADGYLSKKFKQVLGHFEPI